MRRIASQDRSRGFVLVNALVLVAAMAAAAVFLLARAESGRLRLAATQQAEALTHALDAFEAFGLTVLDGDLRDGPLDSVTESWARATYDVPLALGRVSGRITDQQALFNVNWLADQNDARARQGFERLLRRIGIAPQKGDAIVAFLSPQGPRNRAVYGRVSPPVTPLGGPILMLDQLAMMPELQPNDISVLRQHVTVLPGGSRINVNTAEIALLSAMVPEVSSAGLSRALQRRRDAPYSSVEEFFTDMGLSIDPADPAAVDQGLFSVNSNWFAATITATLDDRSATRSVMFRRGGLEDGTQIHWRVSRFR